MNDQKSREDQWPAIEASIKARLAESELTHEVVGHLPSRCPKCGERKTSRSASRFGALVRKLWRTLVLGECTSGVYECTSCAHVLIVPGMLPWGEWSETLRLAQKDLAEQAKDTEASQLAGGSALDVDGALAEGDGDEALPNKGGGE